MDRWTELGEQLDSLLKLRTAPLGVKLYRRIEDAPGDIAPLRFPCAVCQVAGFARYYRRPVLVTTEEAYHCQVGGAALGFWDLEDDFKDGTRNAGSWAKDAKATARLIEGDVIPAGSFQAALFAPLSKMPVAPDIVLAYGTPDQMLSLVYGQIWNGGDRVKLETNGHGGTCRECIAAPYLHNELRLAITDIGERKFAMAYDYEMVAGWPYDKFEWLMEGLSGALTKGIYARPIAPWGFQAWPDAARDRTGLTAKFPN